MLAKEFLSTGKFAVGASTHPFLCIMSCSDAGKAVGASSSREKYGNRVLRWYMDRSLPVTPVNPQTNEETIEGISVVKSLSDLPGASETAVSVITPPSASLAVLKEASSLGVPYIWIQPGKEL